MSLVFVSGPARGHRLAPRSFGFKVLAGGISNYSYWVVQLFHMSCTAYRVMARLLIRRFAIRIATTEALQVSGKGSPPLCQIARSGDILKDMQI